MWQSPSFREVVRATSTVDTASGGPDPQVPVTTEIPGDKHPPPGQLLTGPGDQKIVAIRNVRFRERSVKACEASTSSWRASSVTASSYIFGNPGTTESPILDALLDYPQLRYVVALHEGVALGAASYYAQTSGKPAVVNIHVAPGLGNALGMLYNALKARSPLVVTAGQQDTRLRLRGPVLGHDLVAMAAPLTKWSVQVERADEFALILHRALKIATDPPAGPVFVALPIDVLEQDTDVEPSASRAVSIALPSPTRPASRRRPSCCSAAVDRSSSPATTRRARATEVAALAERLGAAVWCEGIRTHQVLPSAHPNFRLSLPFDTVAIRKALDGADVVLLVGGPFFEEVWYAPGSPCPPSAPRHPRGVVARAARAQPGRSAWGW